MDSAAPWVIVTGGFHERGGMDRANAALAEALMARGSRVHLVAHDIDAQYDRMPLAVVHRVPRPLDSILLGELPLARAGARIARAVTAAEPRARVVVNGGNCAWPDVNWVHSVHAAWPTVDAGAPGWFRAKNAFTKTLARVREARALRVARVVIANSQRTREDLVELVGVDRARVHVVYLGGEGRWREPDAATRAAARAWLGLPVDVPVVVFVGALSHDRNKGIDTLLSAWQRLHAAGDWDARLVAAGAGNGVPRWRDQVAQAGLADRVQLLGFTDRVADLLAAADLLVSPVRYEAYGLNVQEAICRGVPALVSRRAGVSERYPETLRGMTLADPESVDELVGKLRAWRADVAGWRSAFAPLSHELRAYDWPTMARDLIATVDAAGAMPIARAPVAAAGGAR